MKSLSFSLSLIFRYKHNSFGYITLGLSPLLEHQKDNPIIQPLPFPPLFFSYSLNLKDLNMCFNVETSSDSLCRKRPSRYNIIRVRRLNRLRFSYLHLINFLCLFCFFYFVQSFLCLSNKMLYIYIYHACKQVEKVKKGISGNKDEEDGHGGFRD